MIIEPVQFCRQTQLVSADTAPILMQKKQLELNTLSICDMIIKLEQFCCQIQLVSADTVHILMENEQ